MKNENKRAINNKIQIKWENSMQNLLEGLNDKQHEAVVNTEGACLVIARSRKWKNQSINT